MFFNAMKYTKIFGRTIKESPKDANLASHKLLYRGGFIRESVAGRYYFLPLGWRVHQKIQQIIKEEMDKAGAQELLAPVLHPKSLWEETNRTNSVGFELMSIKDRNEFEFVLGGTAEEMLVDLVRKFQISYKDLPFNLYQFSMKFRDELRARGGLLRLREFVMKDAYSFHATEEDFKKEYQKMMDTYTEIFQSLGLKTEIVESDNGYIGGDYCHEFIVESEAGESRYLTDEEGYSAHEDVAKFRLEMVNPTEAIEDFKRVSVPAWVQKIEEMEKHFGKDRRFMLKSVAYVNREGDVIIVVIRGDLEVNKAKLEQGLKMVGQLDSASNKDLEDIGTRTGYVHAMGHEFIKPRKAKYSKRNCEVIYVADQSLYTVRNFIGGHASFEKDKESEGTNVNYGRDFKHDLEMDVAMAQEGFETLDGKKLIAKKGIEVGNIFQLGYHYSSKMKGATFRDADGQEKPYYMGCYGIGLARTLAAIVEVYHDDKGIIWPESVAPFQVHLVGLDLDDTKVFAEAEKVYKLLQAEGVEVLFDDRVGISAGEKFADSDLIGIPYRVVISKKTQDKLEIKKRSEKDTHFVTLEDLLKIINNG